MHTKVWILMVLSVATVLVLAISMIYFGSSPSVELIYQSVGPRDDDKHSYDVLDFEGVDNNEPNITRDKLIVPNFIHLIYLNLNSIKFYQLVNIYSIFLNQKPDRIYIHCDQCAFTGKYWDQLNSIAEVKNILVINKVNDRKTIFGKKIGWIQHRYFIEYFKIRVISFDNF